MHPTPYTELNQVLVDLQSRIQDILADNFIGFYLQGSFAVGDFDQHSDVDFIVIMEDDLSADQVDALQVMHDQVYRLDSEWAKHLEGSYFPRDILLDLSKRSLEVWYLDHGARSLIRSDHCNTLLVRWILREMGIVLAGPPPNTLIEPISTEMLRVEIFETIIEWGNQILQDLSPYYNHFYQTFILLSYCRMFNDLYNGYPGSKREGARWAKANLDPSWSELIDRAWNGRPDPAKKIKQPPNSQDFERTLEFVRLVMHESRSYMVRHTRYQGLIIQEDKVLLIKHREHATGRGYWVIPGGGIDDDESIEGCVMRELKEETNLEVEIEGLLLEEPGHPDGVYRWRKSYICKPISGEPSPGYEPEIEAAENYAITEVRWFDLQDESDWEDELLNDPITYPQLVQARQKLGYIPK